MQPTYTPIAQIFGAPTTHSVPPFQRRWVWSKEEQREALWDEVSGLLEQLEVRQGDAAVSSQCLETMVLEQAQTQTGLGRIARFGFVQ